MKLLMFLILQLQHQHVQKVAFLVILSEIVLFNELQVVDEFVKRFAIRALDKHSPLRQSAWVHLPRCSGPCRIDSESMQRQFSSNVNSCLPHLLQVKAMARLRRGSSDFFSSSPLSVSPGPDFQRENEHLALVL